MSGMGVAEVVLLIQGEFPKFRVVPKRESFWMRTIGALIWCITFGRMKSFMASFSTTVGSTVYTGADWDTLSPKEQIRVLMHERVHLQQAARHGRFLYALLYLFWPFPFFWAKRREEFEKEAYVESMLVDCQYGVNIWTPLYKERTVQYFLSGQYFWITRDRASIEAWFDKVVANLKE